MDVADLRRRIEELESQAAFQEQQHRELDEIVARQDRELLQLQQQLRVLGQRLAEVRDSGAAAPGVADEVPPHY